MKRLALVLVALMATSCTPGGTQLQIGIKRTAVDLAFKDESLPALPPEVRAVLREIPAPPSLPAILELPRTPLPPLKLPALCPRADRNAIPEQAVSSRITKAPVPGRYLYLTTGTVKITLPPPLPTLVLPVILPLTPEVRNVQKISLKDAVGAETEVATQYEVRLIIGSLTFTEVFQVRAAGLYLIKRVIATGATTISFAPSSAVLVYEFGAENSSFESAGVDTTTTLSMVLQGRVQARDIVDVCGTVVDSYRVVTSELLSSADGSYQSRTERFPDCPDEAGDSCGVRYNRRNFATHIGPLPVRQEFHYTDNVVVATPQGTGAAVLEWHYTMTLASLTPLKA